MKRYRRAVALGAGLILAATAGACSGDSAPSTVPRLAGSASAATAGGAEPAGTGNPNAVSGDNSAARRGKLRAAAQCIRDHGAARYQDPLLTSDGYVYTDEVALRDVDGPQLTAIETACRDLIHAADFAMRDQGPPPPKLIAAGVRSAECLRAHGLPNVKDPTVSRPFSPGKGFGLDPDDVPAAGKQDPGLRRAVEACRSILDEEAALSSLGNLGNA